MGRGSPCMLASPNRRAGMSASTQKEPLWQGGEEVYKARSNAQGGMQKTHDRKKLQEDRAA